MYNLVKDALFVPKNLLKYRNKSGLFTFFYLLLLALLISIGGMIHFITYPGNSTITTATTGCSIENATLVCDGAIHDTDNQFALFGYAIYFLNPGETVTDPAAVRMIFQGSSLTIQADGQEDFRMDMGVIYAAQDFDAFFGNLAGVVRASAIAMEILASIVLMVFVTLLGTISFLRLRRFVSYRKIFKLVVFAMTPFALLMTFNGLMEIDFVILTVLMIVSYRSVFILQREMTKETFLHLAEMASKGMGQDGTPDQPFVPEVRDDSEDGAEESDADRGGYVDEPEDNPEPKKDAKDDDDGENKNG
jgi:hypothetical protein